MSMYGWATRPDMVFVTVDQVKASLGIAPADVVDDGWLTVAVCAANRFINHTRRDLPAPTEQTTLGAVMLAGRWYKRRGADEVAAYAEFGGPPPTIDKDIETLLEIGRAYRPVVA